MNSPPPQHDCPCKCGETRLLARVCRFAISVMFAGLAFFLLAALLWVLDYLMPHPLRRLLP